MATAEKLVYSHITTDREVCGGQATIDGTRIRVLDIWSLKQRGLTPEQMLEEAGVVRSLLPEVAS